MPNPYNNQEERDLYQERIDIGMQNIVNGILPVRNEERFMFRDDDEIRAFNEGGKKKMYDEGGYFNDDFDGDWGDVWDYYNDLHGKPTSAEFRDWVIEQGYTGQDWHEGIDPLEKPGGSRGREAHAIYYAQQWGYDTASAAWESNRTDEVTTMRDPSVDVKMPPISQGPMGPGDPRATGQGYYSGIPTQSPNIVTQGSSGGFQARNLANESYGYTEEIQESFKYGGKYKCNK